MSCYDDLRGIGKFSLVFGPDSSGSPSRIFMHSSNTSNRSGIFSYSVE
jgi:hypothetical protein